MEIDTSGSMSQVCQIDNINRDNPNDPKAITGFDIIVDLRRHRTISEGGDLVVNLVATDSNDNVIATIEQPIEWNVSCYYPDEIRLVKKENTNAWEANYLNIDLLQGEVKTLNFEAHIYSKVNNELYYWSNDAIPADDVVSIQYNDGTRTHFLDNTQYPNYTHSDLTVIEDPDEGQIVMVINGGNINIQNNKFNFVTSSNDDIITVNFKVRYSVTFNGETCTLDVPFYISKSPAAASQGNWQNLTAGENGSFYYMDKELRFYTADNLGRIENIGVLGPENVIAAVVYRYDDMMGNKKIVSVDPWQLKNQTTKYWWQQGSTMNTPEIPESGGIFKNGSSNVNPDHYYNLFYECSGLDKNTNYDDISYNQRFECMYNVYAFVSSLASSTNIADGGTFEVVNNSNNSIVTNISNIEEAAHKLANKEYSIRKNIVDNNMIFSIFDYYKTKYNMAINGRILTAAELSIVYSHRDEFATAIQKVDINTTVDAWKKLLIDDENMFIIANSNECYQWNQSHPDDQKVTYPSTQWMDAANYKHAKWFSTADTLDAFDQKYMMPASVAYSDHSTNSLPGIINVDSSNTNHITTHFKLYYIATPCI